MLNAGQIIQDEVNSVDDNPIVDMDSQNVIHGGNFHGDYISFEMDKLKIAVTKMTMLAERQMNYLFHDRINGILPPFVNMGVLGLNYGLQDSQFTATSTTAESQTLSNPMYVHSIPTKAMYDKVRQIVPTFRDDKPKYEEIKALQAILLESSPVNLN